MLSKSHRQVLRVAAILNTLFSIDTTTGEVDDKISDKAMKAAVNFVRTACQQTAYVAGRGLLHEEIERIIHPGITKQRDKLMFSHSLVLL